MRRLSLFKRTHPLSDGTWTYTWERGRQLKSMSKSGATWNFTYDADGLRTKRTDGANTYLYYYDGGLLRCMEYNGVKMFFTYDAQGMPVSMTYNGATYYYALNLQGDVMAILNASSAAVVNYNYNAWGELLSTTGSLANTIGLYNPLRYRSYVYDRETGLYYLQSRYYNPEICRFINADDVDLLGVDGSVLSYNLFAYCKNNPVNASDPSGEFAFLSFLGAVVGGAIGGAIISTVSYVVNSAINGEEITGEGLANAAITGAVSGAIGGAIGTVALVSETATMVVKGVASVGLGIAMGVKSGIEAEGSGLDRAIAGITTGGITAASTFLGSQIASYDPSYGFAGNLFINYAAILFVGAPAEIASVGIQTGVSAVRRSIQRNFNQVCPAFP